MPVPVFLVSLVLLASCSAFQLHRKSGPSPPSLLPSSAFSSTFSTPSATTCPPFRSRRLPTSTRLFASFSSSAAAPSPSNAYEEGFPHAFEDVPREFLDEIEEAACRDMLKAMRSWDVPVPTSLSSTGYVRATGVGPSSLASPPPSPSPPVLLLHGFDSSCLEYRRLHPLLSPHVDTFALDIMGWGFSQLRGITEFSAEAKRVYLYGFWKHVLKEKKMVLVGASLGGAAAVDFAHTYPEAVEKLVLIDAQVYIDGVGPMSSFPPPLAALGIKLLQSKPLRSYAGTLSYHNPSRYSTRDAMHIGRVHTLRPGWDQASVRYMLSGGYTTSNKITSLSPHIETLILWGKEDKILEPKLYAEKFIEDLGTTRAQLKFIEECGHVCHLEKPLLAAEEIVQFVKGGREGGGGWVQAIGPAYGEERREGEKEGRGWLAEMMASFRSTGGEGGKDGGEEGRREEPCGTCHDEEVVDCSNCDGIGSYTTYGRTVQCNVCKGTGLMICRDCYDGEAEDIEGIRLTVREAAVRLGRIPVLSSLSSSTHE